MPGRLRVVCINTHFSVTLLFWQSGIIFFQLRTFFGSSERFYLLRNRERSVYAMELQSSVDLPDLRINCGFDERVGISGASCITEAAGIVLRTSSRIWWSGPHVCGGIIDPTSRTQMRMWRRPAIRFANLLFAANNVTVCSCSSRRLPDKATNCFMRARWAVKHLFIYRFISHDLCFVRTNLNSKHVFYISRYFIPLLFKFLCVKRRHFYLQAYVTVDIVCCTFWSSNVFHFLFIFASLYFAHR